MKLGKNGQELFDSISSFISTVLLDFEMDLYFRKLEQFNGIIFELNEKEKSSIRIKRKLDKNVISVSRPGLHYLFGGL